MAVLNIMSFIVDKMSGHIQAHAENLCRYLPLLWEESKDHNMLRCAILSTLVRIKNIFCSSVFKMKGKSIFFSQYDMYDVLVTNYHRIIRSTAIFSLIFIPCHCNEHK